MTVEYDPLVAEALERIAPAVESDPDETLRRAAAAAPRARARHTRRVLALGFAALVLLGGGALAASQFDVLPWVDRHERSSATFSVDASRTYSGPAPQVLLCPDAGTGSFVCTRGTFPPHGSRVYMLTSRVEAQPRVTRQSMLAQLADAEREGAVDHAAAQRLRADVAAVGDDFFEGLAQLAGITTVGAGQQVPGHPELELVPPPDVPMWAACTADGGEMRCHDLESSRDVAVGTPLYLLQRSRDWVEEPRRTGPPIDVARLFRAVLGRDLKPAENRLLFDLATVATSSAEGGEVHTATRIATAP
jgi:hypothetical protein